MLQPEACGAAPVRPSLARAAREEGWERSCVFGRAYLLQQRLGGENLEKDRMGNVQVEQRLEA